MFHQTISYVRGCNNPHCPAHSRLAQIINLELQYTDKKHDIELKANVESPLVITIRDVTQDLLNFLYLDDIPLEEVRLVRFRRNNDCYPLDIKNTSKTLRELSVTDGCILYFEPIPNAAPPKPCQLTINAPDEKEKITFEWYRAKTTLSMLLEYVIEKFSLQSVERQRIHLLTICDELNLLSSSDNRLSELGVSDRMAIFVQIIPSLSSTVTNENKDVHVECTDDDKKFVIHAPTTATIGELKIKIQKRYEDYHINNFQLFNHIKDEIYTNDTNQNLKSFGIKPGQTIFATIHMTAQNIQPAIVNNENKTSKQLSSSSATTKNNDKIMVICTFPSGNSETIQSSVKDTIDELIKKIDNLTHRKRLVLSEISSSTISCKIKQGNDTSRRLADIGFKPDETIYATIIDKPPTHSSIVSTETSSLSDQDKQPKTNSINKKPIGLNNLGNSCYMSSALQCLAHIPPLTNFFLEGLRHSHMNDGEHTDNDWNPYDQVGDVTGAYAELLWNLWRFNDSDDSYDSFKPTRIKEIIGKKELHFATTDQQDAQEFMTFFLDAIHKELKEQNKKDKNTIVKQLFFGEMKSIITCTRCNKEESIKNPISFLSIPLSRQERVFWINYIPKTGKDEIGMVYVPISGQVGHVVEIFVKRCERPELFYYILAMLPDGELDFKTPVSHIPHDEIILMERDERLDNILPERLEISTKMLTLEDCLQQFLSPEKLEDEWACRQEKCKKKTTAIKRLELCTLPPVLVIQFKRFSHENGLHQKIETFVDYPIEGLDLSEFLPSSENETIYDLITTCNHMGTISGGHYTAYAKHPLLNRNDWYKFDDSSVTRVRFNDLENEIVSRDAYLLVYIRRDILNTVTTV
ncbi:unnamed protein product [Rotaria sp. Silwood2]|nr:unnamed protein product [Rotaria sp. Silwood2]CAF2667577.1 unnamed protein product [Rotaria sp. Silwood2]CAF3085881.1 unnamed protein product [Rotaria sp. Silwood2]CAF4386039.1 unnamed protein product [Rotaria sp. Silwood2]CAF4470910.1 unnamed protein product [Rotaria sp. Silwood2]